MSKKLTKEKAHRDEINSIQEKFLDQVFALQQEKNQLSIQVSIQSSKYMSYDGSELTI